MEENYEWISLRAYDPLHVVSKQNINQCIIERLEQDELCDLFDYSDMYSMEEEYPYSKLTYFIVHNHEKKVNHVRVSLEKEKVGYIMLLETKGGPLELRVGLKPSVRGHQYLKYALEQLKEIMHGNEFLLDTREDMKRIEKKVSKQNIFFRLSPDSHLNDYVVGIMEKSTGNFSLERRYLYQENAVFYGYHGSLDATLRELMVVRNHLKDHVQFYNRNFGENPLFKKKVTERAYVENSLCSKKYILLPPNLLFNREKQESCI